VLTGAQRLHARALRGVDPSGGAVAVLALTLVLLRRRRAPGLLWGEGSARGAEEPYAQMLRLLARRGYPRVGPQTPREFTDGLPAALRPAAATITNSFEQWRYGGREPSAADAESVAAALGLLRRGRG
jgi:hypothetical protein